MAVQDRDYIEVWRKSWQSNERKNITISERTFCTEDTISAVVETAKNTGYNGFGEADKQASLFFVYG
jgi:hypothetical protein